MLVDEAKQIIGLKFCMETGFAPGLYIFLLTLMLNSPNSYSGGNRGVWISSQPLCVIYVHVYVQCTHVHVRAYTFYCNYVYMSTQSKAKQMVG